METEGASQQGYFHLLIYLLGVTVFAIGTKGCKVMVFDVDIEGKALENHVFKTEKAFDDSHCRTMCFLDDLCISYNYGTSKNHETGMCELSDSDHIMHPDDLVDRPGVIYRSAQNNCNCSAESSVCRFNFALGTHRCECKSGFAGSQCESDIDECASNPCQNGGSCQDRVNLYTCTCTAGFTGTNCQTNIDECASNPSNPCQNGGSCQDQVNSFTCTCAAGFTGAHCETDIDECAGFPCLHGGICHDYINSYNCTCIVGFQGPNCETNIDECASNPCLNGGSCHDQVNSYNCTCEPGFTGINCQTNINECTSNPCQNGGSCQDRVNSYTCTCAAGFTGARCQTNIDECASNPCQNGGSCQDQVNSYSCACFAGFTGINCQTNINECASNPCQNGGSCQDQVNSYTCICAAGFTGTNCQTDIDDCADNPCANNGTCMDLINDYNCSCPVGFAGKNCSTIENVWLDATPSVVCVGAKDDQFGAFQVPLEGYVKAFKLVYASGDGLSYLGVSYKGYWGGKQFASTLQIFITNTTNGILAPQNVTIHTLLGIMAYRLPGVTNMDAELLFPDSVLPVYVQKSQTLRVWFGPDMVNAFEFDNYGETCAQVKLSYT